MCVYLIHTLGRGVFYFLRFYVFLRSHVNVSRDKHAKKGKLELDVRIMHFLVLPVPPARA